SAIILWTAFVVLRHHRRQRELVTLAILLLALLVMQITLGVVTVLWRKPADVASAHVATGALTLLAAFMLSIRALRIYSPSRQAVQRGFEILTPSNRLAAAI